MPCASARAVLFNGFAAAFFGLSMCYSIPGKVVRIEGRKAFLDYFGEERAALNELEGAMVGDYAYAQGGFIVGKIPAEDALAILKVWRKRFFELKKKDAKLAGNKPQSKFANDKISKILRKANSKKPLSKAAHSISKSEILSLLEARGNRDLKQLYAAANRLRQKTLKNACCVHGIIEFSNHCRNNCSYCGIRKGNSKLQRYRMPVDEIVETADYAVNTLGFKALVLQSGEDDWYTTSKLVEIVRRIREKCGVLLFMSIGSRDWECYKKLYAAGARGILLRFETSNPKLYKKLHSGPKSDFQKRIGIIKKAKKLGYVIATGSLIGLPGQTNDDLASDIILARTLGAEMYSFGPLIPHAQTPLAGAHRVSADAVLKVLAASRLADPQAKILVTTALETIDRQNGKRRGLLAGANSLMINVTPAKYREKYLIYPGRPDKDLETTRNIAGTLKLLHSLGRAPTDIGV